eukprot:1195947-Prorocentrum_minimum.AAC.2
MMVQWSHLSIRRVLNHTIPESAQAEQGGGAWVGRKHAADDVHLPVHHGQHGALHRHHVEVAHVLRVVRRLHAVQVQGEGSIRGNGERHEVPLRILIAAAAAAAEERLRLNHHAAVGEPQAAVLTLVEGLEPVRELPLGVGHPLQLVHQRLLRLARLDVTEGGQGHGNCSLRVKPHAEGHAALRGEGGERRAGLDEGPIGGSEAHHLVHHHDGVAARVRELQERLAVVNEVLVVAGVVRDEAQLVLALLALLGGPRELPLSGVAQMCLPARLVELRVLEDGSLRRANLPVGQQDSAL